MSRLLRAASAAFFLVFVLSLLWPAAAAAASLPPNCGEHRKITDVLKARYGEYLAARGRAPAGDVELWVGDRRSWTLLTVMPGGIACLIAAGHHIAFSKPPSAKGNEA